MKIEMLKTLDMILPKGKWVKIVDDFVKANEPAMVIHCDDKKEAIYSRKCILQEIKKRKYALRTSVNGFDVYVVKKILEEA